MNRILFGLCWAACAVAAAATPPMDSGSPADVLQLRNIEVIFHTAGSVLPSKDLDLMMSLYADDAVLTDTAPREQDVSGQGSSAHLLEGCWGTLPTREPLDRLHARVPNECSRQGQYRDAVL